MRLAVCMHLFVSLLRDLSQVLQAAESFHGHAVYGIRAFVVRAARLQTVLEDCTAAAQSSDARDKYFTTSVEELAPCSSKALRNELPSLAEEDLILIGLGRSRLSRFPHAVHCAFAQPVCSRQHKHLWRQLFRNY
jgi:hypothetical protein